MSNTPISAAKVMQLRGLTGAGMMECKKFLIATDGDIELAILEMRKAGQLKAQSKTGRIAAEGIISIAHDAAKKRIVMLEVNCETDFVARDGNFQQFCQSVATIALEQQAQTVEQLLNLQLAAAQTVEQTRAELVTKIGENIQLRRLYVLNYQGNIGSYLHGGRIGVIVELESGDANLAKDIAMHIAANRPLVIDAEQIPAEVLAKEREVFVAQAAESGKPAAIIEKMVIGRLDKFKQEVSLVNQAFVKDAEKTVAQVLQQQQARVVNFTRFEVGEGIEKKKDDFVTEVMAQVNQQ